MTVATAKKPAVKKTAKKVPAPAKTTSAKKAIAKAKKVVAKKAAVERTPKRSDAELRALAEKLWAQGITAPHAMSKATRGTSEFVLSRRFIVIATEVIASHGGKPVTVKAARTTSGKTPTVDRLNGMKVEYETIKKWKANGMKGDSPATPLIDAKNAEMTAKAAKTAKATEQKKSLAAVHIAKKSATRKVAVKK